MPNNDSLKEKDELPVFTLIQQIKDGTIAPETINKESRKRCVDALQREGYSVSAMAQIFHKSEKTLRRDLDDIWEERKLTPAVELAKKIIGEFVGFARIHRGHLMRLARSKDASTAEKAQSEFFAFKVSVELIGKLQTMGYLPTKPQAIVGEVFHHVDGQIANLDDLSRQIVEIEKMADGEEDVKKDLNKMKFILNSIRVSEEENKQKGKENEDNQR